MDEGGEEGVRGGEVTMRRKGTEGRKEGRKEGRREEAVKSEQRQIKRSDPPESAE